MPAACSRSRTAGTSEGISTSIRHTGAPSKVRLPIGFGTVRAAPERARRRPPE